MDLQERDVHIAQIIMISLCGVTDKQFTLWIVVLQPILQGSTDEANPIIPTLIMFYVFKRLYLFSFVSEMIAGSFSAFIPFS